MLTYFVQSGSPKASVGRALLAPIEPDEPAPVGEVELVELPVPVGDVEPVALPVLVDPVVALPLVPALPLIADVLLELRT
jgi:hypothetical protein